MKRNNTVRKTSAPLEGYKRIKSSNGDVERNTVYKNNSINGWYFKNRNYINRQRPKWITGQRLLEEKALGRRWSSQSIYKFSNKSLLGIKYETWNSFSRYTTLFNK